VRENLADKLVKIISDYKTMQRLSTGCSKILRSDCVGLCGKHVREKRRACTFSPEDYTQAPSERLGASTASRSAMYFGAGAKGDLDEGVSDGRRPCPLLRQALRLNALSIASSTDYRARFAGGRWCDSGERLTAPKPR
jgi:hypothetical protein